MPNKLGDICKLLGGYAYSSADFLPFGTPVVKIGDVTGGGRINYASMQCVSNEIAKQTARFQTEPNDTLIAMTGANVGKTSRIGPDDPDARINQRVGKFIPIATEGYSKDYIHFLVSGRAAYEYFANAAYGSAQPNISATLIENLPVPDFAPSEATRIGATLFALDDKIDLNRRMNETLEGMARAIFKDWFVDFGPTRAKMEGYAPYLAPDMWSLFPDRLDDDEKPEGWKLSALREVVHHIRETISPSSSPEELFDHYSIPAFDQGQDPVREAGSGILSNKTIVPADVVLLSKLNPEISRVWLVDIDAGTRAICSTEFLVFSPRVPSDRALLYCLMTEGTFKQRLEGMVTGTSKSHQRVGPDAVLAIDLVIAPRQIMDAFPTLAEPMLNRIVANRREVRTLSRTRDLLLPKLMSGEIRVKDAEKAPEAVLGVQASPKAILRKLRSRGYRNLAMARRTVSTLARMATSPSEQATAMCFWSNVCAQPLPSSTQR
jgi:type I restriction enzyme S subunit